MSGILIILVLIALIYLWYHINKKNKYMSRTVNMDGCDCSDASNVEENTLNDMESGSIRARHPVYDDTYRINNQMFWMSDYSQPGQDMNRSLNDDVITPIRPVSGADAMNYLSGVYKVSRFGCEQSI